MNCPQHGPFPDESACPTCVTQIIGNVAAALVPPTPVKPPKKRSSTHPARRTRTTKISHMQKQARTILAREMLHLMESSHKRKLERDEAVSLRGYIETLNELEELDKIKILETTPKKDK